MVREKVNFGVKEFLLLLGAAVAGEKADAGALRLTIMPENEIGQSKVELKHYSGSIDGKDGNDYPYLGAPGSRIDIWSKVNFIPFAPFYNHLRTDSRAADGVSNFLVEITGRDLTGTENADVDFLIFEASGENNFSWKNLIVELYNAGDISSPANRLGTFDAHDLANGDVSFPQLQVNNGLSYQIVVRPRNYADFNLDNKVNLLDKGILSKHWLRTDPNAENMWNDYTDINRNKIIDVNDLILSAPEWLFQGCDPNTFVKSNYINQLGPLLKDRPKLVKGSGLESGLNTNSDIYEDRKARLRRDRNFAKKKKRGKTLARMRRKNGKGRAVA